MSFLAPTGAQGTLITVRVSRTRFVFLGLGQIANILEFTEHLETNQRDFKRAH